MHNPKIVEAVAQATRQAEQDYLSEANKSGVFDYDAIHRAMGAAALTTLCTLRPDVAAVLAGEAVAVPRMHLDMAECWITAALGCESWIWDQDQHEACTETRDALRSLTSPYAAKETRDAE